MDEETLVPKTVSEWIYIYAFVENEIKYTHTQSMKKDKETFVDYENLGKIDRI